MSDGAQDGELAESSLEEGEIREGLQEETEEESFVYPSQSTPPSSSDPLSASAAPFIYPGTPLTPEERVSSAPITMRTASSLHRTLSSSTSGLKEGRTAHALSSAPSSPLSYGVSITPRDASSPFLRQGLQGADLSTTPSSIDHLPLSPLDSPPPLSCKGLDLAELKTLIGKASASGDVERLRGLMSGDGSDRFPSSFVLANSPSPHSGLTPLHYAARRGKVEVCKYLIEEAGAMVELEDGEGEVRLVFGLRWLPREELT